MSKKGNELKTECLKIFDYKCGMKRKKLSLFVMLNYVKIPLKFLF